MKCPKCDTAGIALIRTEDCVFYHCMCCGTVFWEAKKGDIKEICPTCHDWKKFMTPPPAHSTVLIAYPKNRIILAAKINKDTTWKPEVSIGAKWREVVFLPEWESIK